MWSIFDSGLISTCIKLHLGEHQRRFGTIISKISTTVLQQIHIIDTIIRHIKTIQPEICQFKDEKCAALNAGIAFELEISHRSKATDSISLIILQKFLIKAKRGCFSNIIVQPERTVSLATLLVQAETIPKNGKQVQTT